MKKLISKYSAWAATWSRSQLVFFSFFVAALCALLLFVSHRLDVAREIIKKLVGVITLAAFLSAASPSRAATCAIAYSTDYKAWPVEITVDLSTAVVNPTTGVKEIHVDWQIADVGDMAFFKSSATNMTFQYIGAAIPSNTQVVEACAGVIIGVLVLVVAGIVIYVLVKTCKKLLPPTPPNK